MRCMVRRPAEDNQKAMFGPKYTCAHLSLARASVVPQFCLSPPAGMTEAQLVEELTKVRQRGARQVLSPARVNV